MPAHSKGSYQGSSTWKSFLLTAPYLMVLLILSPKLLADSTTSAKTPGKQFCFLEEKSAPEALRMSSLLQPQE